MSTFLITASITLAVCYAGFKSALKSGPKRLIVFYAALLLISLALSALHCFDVDLYGLGF